MTTTPLPPALLERIAAAAVDEGLTDAVYAHVDTPLGRLLVVQSARGLCRLGFPEEAEDRVLAQVAGAFGPRLVASRDATAAVRDALAAYLEGDRAELELTVDLALVRSPFQREVLDGLRAVPRGAVTTYGELAAAIGHPRAVRATGTALGRNPVPIVVPCHRVVPSGGGVGNYGGGSERKRRLLALEGALPAALPVGLS